MRSYRHDDNAARVPVVAEEHSIGSGRVVLRISLKQVTIVRAIPSLQLVGVEPRVPRIGSEEADALAKAIRDRTVVSGGEMGVGVRRD